MWWYFFMQNLLKNFVQYGRYNAKGKKQFIKKVLEWSINNLDNFEVFVQENIFTIDYREIIKIIFLFINLIILFYILLNMYIHWMIINLIFMIFVYIIQFRLIFLFLSILLPSNNIILSKMSSHKTNKKKRNNHLCTL